MFSMAYFKQPLNACVFQNLINFFTHFFQLSWWREPHMSTNRWARLINSLCKLWNGSIKTTLSQAPIDLPTLVQAFLTWHANLGVLSINIPSHFMHRSRLIPSVTNWGKTARGRFVKKCVRWSRHTYWGKLLILSHFITLCFS